MTTTENLQMPFEDLVQVMEDHRREHPSLAATPVPKNELKDLEKIGLLNLGDYAEFGNVIDKAVQHLDEALPNGQLVRASAALIALEKAVQGLKTWMAVKGYAVELSSLRFVFPANEPELGTKVRVDKSIFQSRIDKQLLEAREFGLTEAVENSVEGRMDSEGFYVTVSYTLPDGSKRVSKNYYGFLGQRLHLEETRFVQAQEPSSSKPKV